MGSAGTSCVGVTGLPQNEARAHCTGRRPDQQSVPALAVISSEYLVKFLVVARKLHQIIMAPTLYSEQLMLRLNEWQQPFTRVERYELIARAMEQVGRAGELTYPKVGAQGVLEQDAG